MHAEMVMIYCTFALDREPGEIDYFNLQGMVIHGRYLEMLQESTRKGHGYIGSVMIPLDVFL